MVDNLPWITLLPPVLTIALAILTRKVRLSLGAGIVAAALLVAGFRPLETLSAIWGAFAAQFWDEGFDTYNLFLLLFLVLLGIITSLVMMSGGSKAFSAWAARRIRSRRGAQGLGLGLAFALFIDDYFSALAVGQVTRPVTDKYNVSRAKLAYIVDSTAAPMSVLVPFSSWGAGIIGLMAPVVAASALETSDIMAFLGAAASNYYALAALVLTAVVVVLQLDIGGMRAEERRAIQHARTYEMGTEIPGELSEDLPVHDDGNKRALVVPFAGLVIGVVGSMFITGYLVGGSTDPVEILGDTMLTESLLIGGLIGLGLALYYYLRHTKHNEDFSGRTLALGFWEGIKSMSAAIAILLLAWVLGNLINQLGTGTYLAGLVESAQLPSAWLIPVLFLMAGFMAFATGTSWGSFGLLIPLAGEIILSLNADEYLIPALGAVLAGAVLGDHISPISDTTILSATGSQANIITHVKTQLPYALIAAASALVGYMVAAATSSVAAGLVATFVAMAVHVVVAWRMTTVLVDEIPRRQQAGIG